MGGVHSEFELCKRLNFYQKSAVDREWTSQNFDLDQYSSMVKENENVPIIRQPAPAPAIGRPAKWPPIVHTYQSIFFETKSTFSGLR